MEQIKIKIHKTSLGIITPRYATPGASGMDLRAYLKQSVEIQPGKTFLVGTGISLSIPPGFEGHIRPRSGLAMKHGVTILNSPGTIDSDYRGEIKVLLINHGTNNFVLQNEMRMAQIVFQKVLKVEFKECTTLDKTQRDSKGFGSTGTK